MKHFENVSERNYEIALQMLMARALILDGHTREEIMNAAPDVEPEFLRAFAGILTGEEL